MVIVTPGQLNRRAELYHQLGSMVAAGIPLIKALEMASVNPALRSLRRTFLSLIHHLRSGLTFGESMTRGEGWMPEFDIALLRVGEESGRLDASFKLLSLYYASRAAIVRDTITGLLTTILTLHVFLMVFPLSLLGLLAQGIMFQDYSRCIPFIVEKVGVFGSLYGATILLVYACQGKRGEAWRSLVELVFQLIPVLRTAQKYLALSRLSGALEALISAGVSLVRGWEMASAASGSPRLRRIVSGWGPQLEGGAPPGELINSCSYFPAMFVNLYSTGEISGRLDDALHRLQAYYQEEGFRALRMFTRIMNGTIYGLIVLLVAYSVIRFWLNYYSPILQGV